MAQGNFKVKAPSVAQKQKHKKGGSTKRGDLKVAPKKKAAVGEAARKSKVASKAPDEVESLMVDRAANTGKLNLLKNKSGNSKVNDERVKKQGAPKHQ